MRCVYNRLPVYTGDISGVASALYELGGLIVIHDPSGCNSTYNTHDEVRWYQEASRIYISGLKESDAIMGNDGKFIDDIVQVALDQHPNFIALANSPIPYLNATDFIYQLSIFQPMPCMIIPMGLPWLLKLLLLIYHLKIMFLQRKLSIF